LYFWFRNYVFFVAGSLTYFGDYRVKNCIKGGDPKITITVNYHQFILALNNVLFVNIANITLMSYILVTPDIEMAFQQGRPSLVTY